MKASKFDKGSVWSWVSNCKVHYHTLFYSIHSNIQPSYAFSILTLGPSYSKHGLQTSSIGITWELVRNAD